jgi:hypothetical protein
MTFMTGARILIGCTALLFSRVSHADEDDAQLWLSAAASGSIKGDLIGLFDVNTRIFDNATHVGHVQLRGGLGWRVAPGVTLGGGYSYVRTESLSGIVVHEHRIFQQASYPIVKLGKAELVGRTRLEQRWFNGVDGTLHRFRQQVRLNVPLDGPKGLRGIVYTEGLVLLNRQSERVGPGLNQVRTFAGLGIPLKGRTSLEAGYLNQAVFPGENRMAHALNLGLVTSF